nr:hypothetical protein [Nakamurella aerolata]
MGTGPASTAACTWAYSKSYPRGVMSPAIANPALAGLMVAMSFNATAKSFRSP